ncbi:hypothetical protein ADK35_03070, partial [Streptomyces viridochromogenes]
MSGTGTAERTTDEGHGLRRSLGFRDLVVYGLLFIAPMAPVGVFGTLDARSQGAVALVYGGGGGRRTFGGNGSSPPPPLPVPSFWG